MSEESKIDLKEYNIPNGWGKCYIVRDGNVYDEYDGTKICSWDAFRGEVLKEAVDNGVKMKFCGEIRTVGRNEV